MERWEAKIIAVILSFLLPFVSMLIPYKVAPWMTGKGERGEQVMSCLVCFGGGIFLGTFLLHLGPEVRYILDQTLKHINYPIADLIIGCGFFFVLFLEKIVTSINSCLSRRKEQKKAKLQQMCLVFRAEQTAAGEACANCRKGKPCLGMVKADGPEPEEFDSEFGGSQIALKAAEETDSTRQQEQGELQSRCSVPATEEEKKGQRNEEEEAGRSAAAAVYHHSIRSFVLAFALSFHHVYEGLALGLQYSIEKIFTITVAIMCHEIIISISLGLQLVKCGYSGKAILTGSLFYSLVLPIGVVLGIVLSETRTGDTGLAVANGIVQAFSTGTFIYVTFFEILSPEIGQGHNSVNDCTGLVKIVGVALGFAVTALLALLNSCPSAAAANYSTESEFPAHLHK